MPIKEAISGRTPKYDFNALFRYVVREVVPVVQKARATLNLMTGAPGDAFATTTDLEITWSLARVFRHDLSSTLTSVVFVDPEDVGEYFLEVTQVGGGNTIGAWPTNVVWVGAVAPTMTATNGRIDLYRFFWDGTRYIGDARQDIG